MYLTPTTPRRSAAASLLPRPLVVSTVALLAAAFVLMACAGTASAVTESFLDVRLGHAYFEPIQGLHDAGVVDGYPVEGGTEFRPDNTVWRAQFAKMVLGATGVTVTESAWDDTAPPFDDMEPDDPDDLYPHDYIAEAGRLGITYGTSPTTFSPYQDISRAQMITMVVRAGYSLKPEVMADLPADYTGSLPGFGSVDHGHAMRAAEYNGLLTGLQGFGPGWDPWAKATRAEAAQVMWNLHRAPTRPQPTVLKSDDFSDTSSGWRQEGSSTSSVVYLHGYYQISLFVPEWLRWTQLVLPMADGTIEADAWPLESGVKTEYGLVFRYLNDSNFYLFTCTNTGAVRVWRQKEGVWTPLTKELSTAALRKGTARNHLRVTFVADRFTVAVNHVEIGTFTDPSFSVGLVGLYAGSSTEGPTSVAFDDFTASDPPVR